MHKCLYGNPTVHYAGTQQSSLRAYMLSGKPGIGITEVAIEYLYRHKSDYHVIAWLTADKLQQQFEEFAISLGIVDPKSNNTVTTWNILLGWLQNPLSVISSVGGATFLARWLLIMDDVTADSNISEFWPRDGNGSILVLGKRSSFLTSNTIKIEFEDIPPLPAQDAFQLFKSIADVDDNSLVVQDVIDIVNDWNCIPAAVIRVATKYRNGRQNLADFKSYQADHREEIIRQGVSNMSSIAAIWALEDRSNEEQTLLSVLPFLHHDRIPEAMFSSFYKSTQPLESSLGYPACLRRLRDDRLLEVSQSPTDGISIEAQISVEKVLQDGIRAVYLEFTNKLSTAFITATAMVGSMWPHTITAEKPFSELDERERWKICQDLAPHVDRIAEEYVKFDVDTQRLCATVELTKLLIEVSW